MNKITLGVIFSSLLALNGIYALAQEQELAEPQQFSIHASYPAKDGKTISGKEIIKQAAKHLGVDPNDRRVKATLAGRGYGQQRAAKGYQPKILQHAKGTAGIKFAKPEEIDAYLSTFDQQVPTNYEEMAAEHIVQQSKLIQESLDKYRKLPVCSKSSTEKIVAGKKEVDPLKAVLYDVLILPDDKIKDDPLKLFGRSVYLLEVQPGAEAIAYQMAESALMTCLPARMRVTKEFVFKHQGIDALKNYDDDPHGAGKLDPSLNRYKKIYP